MTSDLVVTRSPVFLNHVPPTVHFENPQRLEGILSLFDGESLFAKIPVIAPKEAKQSDLTKVHTVELVKGILSKRDQTGWMDADTYLSEKSVETALLASGSTIELALEIWKGNYRRGFSLVRPPGHHATADRAMGFCLFNNVALAVAAVLSEAPHARLAVVDFDLHHGNGTQWSFYDNPNVLFVSSHRYPYYPGTGTLEEVGEGKGKGTKINFPLGRAYGDELFLDLYSQMVFPMLREFAPEMIFVSAGFDGHIEDPMGGFQIQTATYGLLAEGLIAAAESTAKGKILFCLEGGYHPRALKDSVTEVLQKMVQAPRAAFETETYHYGTQENILDRFRKFHRPFFPTISG